MLNSDNSMPNGRKETTTMKKINIQNEANVNAEGAISSGHCDPCIILENGMVFTSQIDLAEYLGVSSAAVSNTICGRARTCKGYHIISASRLAEGFDAVLTRLRETSTMEEDAKRWRAYQEEQERIRIAEERRLAEERKARQRHEEEVAKATAKVERCREIEERMRSQYNEATARRAEAETALAALTGNNTEEVAA